MTKICTRCLKAKPLLDFHRQKSTKDGFKYKCRGCNTSDAIKWARDNLKRRVEITSAWNKRNPRLCNHILRLSQLRKINRVPAWADLEAIKSVYLACPSEYEVDHIIPIKGKEVSGLHVANNLQYLTASENRRKRSEFNDWEIE